MLGDEHAEELADYLRDNSRTELLHLGANDLTDDGALVIADALSTCAVKRLSLIGNNLQDDAARALADALAAGFAPEQLDLSDNLITDAGAIELVCAAAAYGGCLTWLDLRANPQITDEGRRDAAAAAQGGTHRFELVL